PDSSGLDRALPAEVRMRAVFPVFGALFIGLTTSFVMAARAEPAASTQPDTTLNFAVMRNGTPIGNSTVRLRREGEETVAEIVTHIQVKIAYVTVYRFDQSQTERWADGNLVAFTSITDDNGTPHKVVAKRQGNTLLVDADGKLSEVDPTLTPVSLWNPTLVRKKLALNPQDGTITPVSVVDHGEEKLVLDGRA